LAGHSMGSVRLERHVMMPDVHSQHLLSRRRLAWEPQRADRQASGRMPMPVPRRRMGALDCCGQDAECVMCRRAWLARRGPYRQLTAVPVRP